MSDDRAARETFRETAVIILDINDEVVILIPAVRYRPAGMTRTKRDFDFVFWQNIRMAKMKRIVSKLQAEQIDSHNENAQKRAFERAAVCRKYRVKTLSAFTAKFTKSTFEIATPKWNRTDAQHAFISRCECRQANRFKSGRF